jgi:hypothetical protein
MKNLTRSSTGPRRAAAGDALVGRMKMKRLIDIGFRSVGKWIRSLSGIECLLHECVDARNILYCFVCQDSVLYVGKTVQPLKKRMYGYQNPGPTQSTNIRVNKEIRDLLTKNNQVDVYALPDNGLLHFGVFHINLAAGLEDCIVKTLNPSWNKIGSANNAIHSDGNSCELQR